MDTWQGMTINKRVLSSILSFMIEGRVKREVQKQVGNISTVSVKRLLWEDVSPTE